MDAKLKNAYIAEVQYQTKMLNHLKKWLRNLIIFFLNILSSCSVWCIHSSIHANTGSCIDDC